MPSPIDAAAEAAEFDALVAELEADQGDVADESEEATPEADASEGDPEADEESEEIEEETEGDEPEDDEELEDDAVASEDVEAFKTELAELLDGGDLKAVAEKLGLDPSIFKLNNKQFKAARVALRDATRKENEAKAAQAGAERARDEIKAKSERVEQHYGPIYQGFEAYKAGDPTKVREAIEQMTGDTFQNVAAAIARAAKGLDPAQVEIIKLRKELAAKDEAKAKEAEAAAAAQVAQQDVTRIGEKLKGTPLDGVEGAAADIAKVMRDSIDPKLGKPTKTLKEAYKEVKATYAKRAAELAKVTQRPSKTPPKGKPPAKEKQRLAPLKTPPAGGKKLTPEQEFARELELAKKDTARAERSMRRVR